MKFIVFGLGNYGAALSKKLISLGHEVIGVDLKMESAEKLKSSLTHTIAMDAGNPEAVRSLPLRDVDVVVNAIGENEGSNIMLTATLKQLNVKRIICRVITPLQKTVLDAMGIHEFVYPEADSAERLAYKLDLKGVTESYKITEDYQILELLVPDKFVDHPIEQLELEEKYNILPIAILRETEVKNIIGTSSRLKHVVNTPAAGSILRRGDRLLLFGSVENLENFIED